VFDGDVEESVLEEDADEHHRLMGEDPLEARSWGGDEGWLEEVNVFHDDEKAPFVGVVGVYWLEVTFGHHREPINEGLLIQLLIVDSNAVL
jgi:hypothetical protein